MLYFDMSHVHICNQYGIEYSCVDPESFARGDSTLTTFFYEGKEDPNSTKSTVPFWGTLFRLGPL